VITSLAQRAACGPGFLGVGEWEWQKSSTIT
jgi:hypothetical protein